MDEKSDGRWNCDPEADRRASVTRETVARHLESYAYNTNILPICPMPAPPCLDASVRLWASHWDRCSYAHQFVAAEWTTTIAHRRHNYDQLHLDTPTQIYKRAYVLTSRHHGTSVQKKYNTETSSRFSPHTLVATVNFQRTVDSVKSTI